MFQPCPGTTERKVSQGCPRYWCRSAVVWDIWDTWDTWDIWDTWDTRRVVGAVGDGDCTRVPANREETGR